MKIQNLFCLALALALAGVSIELIDDRTNKAALQRENARLRKALYRIDPNRAPCVDLRISCG